VKSGCVEDVRKAKNIIVKYVINFWVKTKDYKLSIWQSEWAAVYRAKGQQGK
jgi:hypothetical protein